MTFPTLIPAELFPVEHRLDGGPNRDGNGWGRFEYDPAPNVPDIDDLTWGVIIHTTETGWVPSYEGGVHPTGTIILGPNRRIIEHVRLDRRAGTLRGSSTVEGGRKVPTNRARVHQYELVSYSAWWIAAQYGRLAVRDIAAADKAFVARLIRWHHEAFGVPLIWRHKPAGNYAHPMPHAEWVPLDGRRQWGIADHATAPDDSTHWDSDNIDRPRIIELATKGDPVNTVRVAGANRYATAVAASKKAYPAGAPRAYVAAGRSNDPQDPLSGLIDALNASTFTDGPLLFTEPDRLTGATADELVRLDPEEVVILGGPAVVSDAVRVAIDRL